MLEINNLKKRFNKGTQNEIKIFDDFNIYFEKNKCTAIIGTNGSGKSTLINLIAGSFKSDNGSFSLNGKDISNLKEEERSNFFGRVYQNPSLGVAPSLTILENMAIADKKGQNFFLRKLINKDRIDYYKSLLEVLDLGLENIMDTKVKYLSGGQRQSLSLIMATMKYPDMLLLDEHTAALDPKTSHLVMNKTKELIEKFSMTAIIISHNISDALNFSDRIVMLDKGRIVLDRNSRDLEEEDLKYIYNNKIDSMGA